MTDKARTPGLAHAAQTGDRRAVLESLRDALAKALEDGVPARDLASLSRRLMQVMEELEALDAADDPNADDELARRRAATLSAAAGQPSAPGGDARAAGGGARP